MRPRSGASTASLVEPLSSGETQRLVAGLLEAASVPGEVCATVAARSEGNPFYAEESVRLLRDRAVADAARILDGVGAERCSREGEAVPVPGSVQAIIAARLDTLAPRHKAVLADAAVVGTVFWDGTVTALALGDRGGADEALRNLVAKQLVHRVRESSMQGETEYAFCHALARDVAYGQLPRAVRARKHAATAEWIEGKAGDRVDDFAEILAHHCATAVDLAKAAGDAALAEALLQPATRYLSLAGDRAWSLDVAAAERHYAHALTMDGVGDLERYALLEKRGRASVQLGRPGEAVAPLEEAVEGLRAAGEARAAALAQMTLGEALFEADEGRSLALQIEAVRALEAEGPSPELLRALNDQIVYSWGQADPRGTLNMVGRADEVADVLGVPPAPQAVCGHGAARCDVGDAGGLDDLQRALGMVRAEPGSEYASDVSFLAANETYMYEGPHRGLEIAREGLGRATRRGHVDGELTLRVAVVYLLEAMGDWDALVSDAEELEPRLESAGYWWLLHVARVNHLWVQLKRGAGRGAADLAHQVADDARVETGHTVAACATVAAMAALPLPSGSQARELLTLAAAAYRRPGGFWWCEFLPSAVRCALALGDETLAETFVESVEPLQPIARKAVATAWTLAAEARGEREAATASYADVAAAWHEFEMPYEEAQAHLGQGRCLVALGRAPEAALALAHARAIFARLGARPALEETERLIGQIAEPGGDGIGGSRDWGH